MAKRDLRPARCFISRPLLQARVPLSTHISDGTMLPGAPAQVVPVPRDAARIESISPCYKQYASPTEACWADRVRMRRTGVRPLHAVCQSERSFSRPSAGARRDCPPRVGPRPGSAWLTALSSTRLVRLTEPPVLARLCSGSPQSPPRRWRPVLALHPSCPSFPFHL